MTWKVLVSAPYMLPVIDRFRPLFNKNNIELILPMVNERLSEDELIHLISDIDGVICGDDRFTERVLFEAPKLKVISKWGTGIDSIDKKACERFGIKVCNTPNAFTDPVADTVMGFILCFSRQLLRVNEDMHNGIWLKLPGRSLSECTLGVIGVGNIGKAVVRRAVASNMNVLCNDIVTPPQDFLEATNAKIVSIEELLSESDFVSLNCDLNPSSYHLISYNEFQIMKPFSYLINTARGPIVDEVALIKALKEKKIAGAGLDVFEEEPIATDSPLLKMENVLLSPHNANSSQYAWETVHYLTINNLIKVLVGEENA